MNFLKSGGSLTQMTDTDMLTAYREQGDMAVLAALYERYMHLVYGLCLKYLKDKDQSKDAVMQIFEELISAAKRHEVNNFKSWLHVLSRNHCLMQLRSAKNRQMEPLDNVAELPEQVRQESVWGDDISRLKRCRERLPAEQKATIYLFFDEEQCYKEIAITTGYALNEVKSYIQNAKRNLKICMEKYRERR